MCYFNINSYHKQSVCVCRVCQLWNTKYAKTKSKQHQQKRRSTKKERKKAATTTKILVQIVQTCVISVQTTYKANFDHIQYQMTEIDFDEGWWYVNFFLFRHRLASFFTRLHASCEGNLEKKIRFYNDFSILRFNTSNKYDEEKKIHPSIYWIFRIYLGNKKVILFQAKKKKCWKNHQGEKKLC